MAWRRDAQGNKPPALKSAKIADVLGFVCTAIVAVVLYFFDARRQLGSQSDFEMLNVSLGVDAVIWIGRTASARRISLACLI